MNSIVPNTTIAGIVVAMIVSVVVPVAALIYSIRKRGRGNLMFALMGGLGLALASNLSGIVTIFQFVKDLQETSFIFYLIIMSISICAFDLAVRFFIINYASKTGLGFYKGFAIGAGMASGLVILQVTTYFQLFQQARMINDGSFLKAVSEQIAAGQTPVTMEDAYAFQDAFAAINPTSYFVEALVSIATIFLYIAVTLLFVKLFREGKKLYAAFITFGIRIVYEIIWRIFYFAPTEYMGRLFTDSMAQIFSVIFSLIVVAASVLCILWLKNMLPAEEVLEGSSQQKPRERVVQQQQEKKAWSEIRNLNTKNYKSPANEEEDEEIE